MLQVYRTKVAKLAEGGLPLAEGAFALLSRASLPENMTACLGLISLLIELLDERAAPLLGPVAATVGRVSRSSQTVENGKVSQIAP